MAISANGFHPGDVSLGMKADSTAELATLLAQATRRTDGDFVGLRCTKSCTTERRNTPLSSGSMYAFASKPSRLYR